jgi:hypothetical protein
LIPLSAIMWLMRVRRTVRAPALAGSPGGD